jgi:hypothetical protein
MTSLVTAGEQHAASRLQDGQEGIPPRQPSCVELAPIAALAATPPAAVPTRFAWSCPMVWGPPCPSCACADATTPPAVSMTARTTILVRYAMRPKLSLRRVSSPGRDSRNSVPGSASMRARRGPMRASCDPDSRFQPIAHRPGRRREGLLFGSPTRHRQQLSGREARDPARSSTGAGSPARRRRFG